MIIYETEKCERINLDIEEDGRLWIESDCEIIVVDKEQVDEIAQGRVWTGTDAKRLGLVDEIGNLDAAIAEAAKLAKIEKYKIADFPKYETEFENILSKMFGMSIFKSQNELIKEYVGEQNYQKLEQLKNGQKMKGVQAIMPYQIVIK